ncbi:mitogen-activated protein kinase kinase 1 [Fistulifera solaris]|uniref:mitogen-activated protein kinase kinase n=1 Tax=Fistulifera solaris TaxID=1519565 RepID=A0A1Z5KE04_FISSO|nr:mitogen-activated protein kinase kinase 1 [Fistulifera solaris]|eukprot:GAX24544.1 mitogen-activated protein kinase kinase 1 [Fistulifera solaris]
MTRRIDILSLNIDAINAEAEELNCSYHSDEECFRHEGVTIGADFLRLEGETLTRGELAPGSLRLDHIIGKGAFSEVRLGLWTRKNDEVLTVAVKDFRVISGSSERRSMLVRELKALTKVQSDHIIRLYGAYLEETHVTMVLEYMNLGSLDAIIQQTKAMKEAMVAPIAYQILLGLRDLHEKGIMHRDLKPANVLLNSDGEVKLCDAGMASLGEHTLNSTVLGTAKYMAPERLTKSYGRLSDIWSFGLVVYECVTGRHPFSKIDSLVDLLVTVEESDVNELLSFECHSGLKEIIECSLHADPEQRMPANILLKSPWFSITHKIENTKTASDHLRIMLPLIEKQQHL